MIKLLNKLYDDFKNFIKETWKILLVFAILFVVLTYPLPYYIYNGGGTIDVNTRVEIENGYESKGSFNLAYVSELRATIPTWILAKILPSWDLIKMEDLTLSSKETNEDMFLRDKMMLNTANQTAIAIAYQKAGKKFEITKTNYTIAYIDEEADTNLKIGDHIVSLSGKTIKNLDQISTIIQEKEIGDTISITFERNGKNREGYMKVKKLDDKKMVGISFLLEQEYRTDPTLQFHFAERESGPSGGLMLTLSIYDKLVSEDITYGRKIVGTGTIESDGSVGSIGGIKYKLKGAVQDHADVFLAPAGKNYEECVKLKEEYNYPIEILSVASFNEALQKLKDLES